MKQAPRLQPNLKRIQGIFDSVHASLISLVMRIVASNYFILSLVLAASFSSGEAAAGRVASSDELVARALANNNNVDYSFLGDYSLKFQGCHHVQQWNEQANNNNNNQQQQQDQSSSVRIVTKRLARFRLCPSDSCSNDRSTGCTSKFGDYVVDLSSFVESYLQVMESEKQSQCAATQSDCEGICDGNDDQDTCMATCYEEYGMTDCVDDGNDANNNFNPANFAYCAQVDLGNVMDDAVDDAVAGADKQYFVGPYCADQGGDVKLGVFTDDSCTTFAQKGEQAFYKSRGFMLPYSDTSLVTTRCLGCQDYQTDDANAANNNAGEQGCAAMYSVAGKCETRMDLDYPNESSCSYIEGIKIVRQDGVIRTSTVKKSKAAAVAIGLFLTTAVLLAAYVYYLRTKLARAQINLMAASQPLT